MDEVLETLRQEFSDLTDAAQWTRLIVRLGLAIFLGGLIGYERERHEKAAGLRTHMLVALGTAMFVLVPQQAGMSEDALSRVVQGLLAGVGFLCAGTVVKKTRSGHVQGLTTAAGVWSTAAIGVAVGLGREGTAIVSTVITLAILAFILRIEKRRALKQENAAKSENKNDAERV